MFGPAHVRLEVLAEKLERRQFISGLIAGLGGGAYLVAVALIVLDQLGLSLGMAGLTLLFWLWRVVRIDGDADAYFDVAWYRERRS